MRKIWDIAWLYLYTTYKDRSSLLYGFAMPLIFTAVIGFGISGLGEGEPQTSWRLDLVDLDRSAVSQGLAARLAADPVLDVQPADAESAAAALAAGETAAVLSLPAGLGERLLAGEQMELDFSMNVEEPVDAQLVEQAVLAAISQVSSSVNIAESSLRVAEDLQLFTLDGAPGRDAYFAASLETAEEAWAGGSPVTVQASQVTGREDTSAQVPAGFRQTSPGVGVMFTMFFITYGGASLLLEREQGTLRRLLVTPTPKWAILAGKILGIFLAGLAQFSILVLFGQLVFSVDWGAQPAALALMAVAFVFCITCFSILLAALVRTYAQLDALSTLIILPLSALGGAMWPIEIVPAWMQQLALFLPTGWAMRGFHDIITRGLGFGDILLEAGVLFAFGLVFLAIGAWRFKYE
ncbi:MAG: ABC transporter permease [Anaerolineales bacterium]|nr:ABC transporter permease [Anaerolineales bacterium]